jgi:hypothetical protein
VIDFHGFSWVLQIYVVDIPQIDYEQFLKIHYSVSSQFLAFNFSY